MSPWPFSRKRPDAPDLDEALWAADRALLDAQHLSCRANGIGEKLRETGRRNHFGEAVTRAIGGT